MLPALLLLAGLASPARAVPPPPERPTGPAASVTDAEAPEPIRFLERYRPTYFLLGKPITKVQISFQIQVVRDVPVYFGYTQLMMWDLFKDSAPFRDINYNPELFYRFPFGVRAGFEHESNGKAGPDSRAWNRVSFRYGESRQRDGQTWWWWSLKASIPYGMGDEPSRQIPRYRGIWEAQIGLTDLFSDFFDVNEIFLRVYGGGRSKVNPLQGGQELTYREKTTARKVLLPLYVQIFHGYGENLLDADENRWGLRAGFGF
ncbi:MAG: phospholipase A [Bdellovibrionales bacterium]|nr:phospholipase A [Bdellovibrionales bacterium]